MFQLNMNNRQSGRRRGRNNNSNNNNRPQSGGRGGADQANRIDSRARGNAVQMIEKFKNLARHAQLSGRSEEHASELQSLMRISYAVFFLNKKKHGIRNTHINRDKIRKT